MDRAFGAFRVGLTAVGEGSRYDDVANSRRLGGYGTLDLRAEYAFTSALSLQARVANVFDRDYETVAFYNQPGREWYPDAALRAGRVIAARLCRSHQRPGHVPGLSFCAVLAAPPSSSHVPLAAAQSALIRPSGTFSRKREKVSPDCLSVGCDRESDTGNCPLSRLRERAGVRAPCAHRPSRIDTIAAAGKGCRGDVQTRMGRIGPRNRASE